MPFLVFVSLFLNIQKGIQSSPIYITVPISKFRTQDKVCTWKDHAFPQPHHRRSDASEIVGTCISELSHCDCVQNVNTNDKSF